MEKRLFYPEIERLRGVACLLILIQHTTLIAPLLLPREILPSLLYNGQGGLPLFFVISGFVVTTTLARYYASAQELPTFLDRLSATFASLKGFFLRRVCRLLPLACFNFLLAAIAFFWAFENDVLPYQADWGLSFVRTGIEHLFCVYNLAIPPYLTAEPMHYGGIGPYWSLSVEGQFYFFWPLLLLALKTPSRQALGALILCCIGIFVSRPLAEIWVEGTGYYHTLCNLDGLFLGAFLAFLRSALPSSAVKSSWGSRMLAVFLIAVLWIYPSLWSKEGPVYRMVPILGCAGGLVWMAAQNRNGVLGGRWIAPCFEFLGKRSYAIYVFQLLLSYFAKRIVDYCGLFQTEHGIRSSFYATGQFLIFLGALIVLVEASHRWIEVPARHWAHRLTAQ
ncbi:MAG: acyltransferase [Holosporales bacterium]|jgi:peptidoglycan/LPS O-acetylase OafA/YrhL|nr:acyltransferase [Holosporales bacterium]